MTQQTTPIDEILIWDDASSFPAKDFAPPHVKVRIVRPEKNCGPCFGRNALLAEAKSQYVHFHDADDGFYETWCEEVKSQITKTIQLFKRTHQDRWEEYQLKFSTEQLADLQGAGAAHYFS